MNDLSATAEPRPSETASMSPKQRTMFVAILLLAAAVRLAQLNAQSLTMDEVKDLALARGGVAQLQASEDRFPPLYHTLLDGWLKLVPWDAQGRGFSMLCGVLTVVAVGGLARVLEGPAAALWAAGLTAAAPIAVWYSVEARAYSLYLLVAAIALWQFAAAMTSGAARPWALFAAASIAGAYTHYYFGLLIALAGLTFLASRPRGAAFRRGIATFAIIAIATAPSLWLLKHDLDQPWGYARTSRFSLSGLAYTYFSYLSGYTLGPSLRELHTLSGRDAAIAAAPWIAVLGAAAAILAWHALVSFAPPARNGAAIAFIAFCLAPAAIIGVVSHFGGFGYNVRHAVWAFVPLAAMLGVGMAHSRQRWLAGTATVLIGVAFGVAHFNRLATAAHANEDVRGAAQLIVASAPPAPTLVLAGYMSKPLAAYLPADWPLVPVQEEHMGDPAAALACDEVRGRAAPGERVWLVYTREFHGDPNGKLFATLDKAFEMKLVAELAGVKLYRGTVP